MEEVGADKMPARMCFSRTIEKSGYIEMDCRLENTQCYNIISELKQIYSMTMEMFVVEICLEPSMKESKELKRRRCDVSRSKGLLPEDIGEAVMEFTRDIVDILSSPPLLEENFFLSSSQI
jgi:hypothetical protein